MEVAFVEMVILTSSANYSMPHLIEVIHASLNTVCGMHTGGISLKKYIVKDGELRILLTISTPVPDIIIRKLGTAISHPESTLHTLIDIKRIFRGARMHVLQPVLKSRDHLAKQHKQPEETINSIKTDKLPRPPVTNPKYAPVRGSVVSCGRVVIESYKVPDNAEPLTDGPDQPSSPQPIFVESIPFELTTSTTDIVAFSEPTRNQMDRLTFTNVHLLQKKMRDSSVQSDDNRHNLSSKFRLSTTLHLLAEKWSDNIEAPSAPLDLTQDSSNERTRSTISDDEVPFQQATMVSSDGLVSESDDTISVVVSPPPKMVRKRGTDLWDDEEDHDD